MNEKKQKPKSIITYQTFKKHLKTIVHYTILGIFEIIGAIKWLYNDIQGVSEKKKSVRVRKKKKK